jgi:hypothetical protein
MGFQVVRRMCIDIAPVIVVRNCACLSGRQYCEVKIHPVSQTLSADTVPFF